MNLRRLFTGVNSSDFIFISTFSNNQIYFRIYWCRACIIYFPVLRVQQTSDYWLQICTLRLFSLNPCEIPLWHSNIDDVCVSSIFLRGSTNFWTLTSLFLILALLVMFISEFPCYENNTHCSQIHHCLSSVFRLTFLYSHFNVWVKLPPFSCNCNNTNIANINLEFYIPHSFCNTVSIN